MGEPVRIDIEIEHRKAKQALNETTASIGNLTDSVKQLNQEGAKYNPTQSWTKGGIPNAGTWQEDRAVENLRRSLKTQEQLAREAHEARKRIAAALRGRGQISGSEMDSAFKKSEEQYRKDSGINLIEQQQKARFEQEEILRKRTLIGLTDQQWQAQQKFNEKKRQYTQMLKEGGLEQKQYNQLMREATDEMNAQSAAADGFGSKIASIAAGWISANAAFSLFKQNYDNMVAKQGEAKSTQLDFGSALREAMKNVDQGTSALQLEKDIRGIADQVSVTPTVAMNAYSEMASAKGSASEDDVKAALSFSLRSNPDDAGKAASVGKAMLQEKTRQPGRSMGEIAGLFMAAKAIGIEGDQDFHDNVAAALSNASAPGRGNTYQEMAALRAVLATGMGDSHGRTSTNAFIGLVAELDEKMVDVKGGTMDKIRALQDPKYKARRHKLLGAFDDDMKAKKRSLSSATSVLERESITGEIKALYTKIQLYKGDKKVMAEFEANLAKMPKNQKDAEARAEEFFTNLAEAPSIQLGDINRASAAAKQQSELSDIKGARSSASRQAVQDATRRNSFFSWEEGLSGYLYDLRSMFSSNPEDAATAMIKERGDLRKSGSSWTDRAVQGMMMTPENLPLKGVFAASRMLGSSDDPEKQISIIGGLLDRITEITGRMANTAVKQAEMRAVEVTVETKVPAKAKTKPPAARPSAALGGK